jgi:hypothetical protein
LPTVGAEPTDPGEDATPEAKKKYKWAKKNYDEHKKQHDEVVAHHVALTGGAPVVKKFYSYSGPFSLAVFDDPETHNAALFRIQIWALKDLRPGGYAPGGGGEYVPESAKHDEAKFLDNVQQSLPRFVQWMKTMPAEYHFKVKSVPEFLAIPVPEGT